MLAVMGLLAALAMPSFGRLIPGFESKASVRQVTAALRDGRALAIRDNREVVVTFDLDLRTVRVADLAPVHLPMGLGLSLLTGRSELIDDGEGAIRFFPDGTSTGGGISILHNSGTSTVLVDWLTGHVTSQP